MRRKSSVLVLSLACLCAASSAYAAGFAGVNYGVTFFSASRGGSITTFAVPGNPALFTPASVPGLRIGNRTASGNEFHMDLGLMALSSEGSSFTSLQVTLNYQREFMPADKFTPYVNAGVGVFHAGVEDASSNNPELGFGFGARNRIADGWGDVRFEVRLDHYFEDSQGIPSSNAISIEAGFDLNFSKP